MAKTVETFIKSENPYWKGFLLAVRNDWSQKIRRIHISEDEKEKYVQEFGDEILYEDDFFQWWEKIKMQQQQQQQQEHHSDINHYKLE